MVERSMSRGDDYPFSVQVQQPPAGAPFGSPPVPADITGWKMWFTAKYNYADQDSQAAVALSSDTTGITFTQPLIGIAEITIPKAATRLFPDGDVELLYDVQVKDLFGRVFTIERGTITVSPDVTRALA